MPMLETLAPLRPLLRKDSASCFCACFPNTSTANTRKCPWWHLRLYESDLPDIVSSVAVSHAPALKGAI